MADCCRLDSAERLRAGLSRLAQAPEMAAARRFVRSGAVVFDVGAHIGCWSLAALAGLTGLDLHLFEPAPEAFAHLTGTAAAHFPAARVNNLALGGFHARRRFHVYRDSPSWSGFFRRRGEEARGSVRAPEPVDVACTTLDAYCEATGVTHINYLKIDVEGAEAEVLAGASGLLAAGAVDALQFEYGGTFADAGATLAGVHAFLRFRDYVLLVWRDGAFTAIEAWDESLETYGHDNFLALHRRHLGWFRGDAPAMLDLPTLVPRHGVTPRGVIHVGAHEGRELALYRKMGASPILFIEANPEVAATLRRAMADEADVLVAEYAVTDGSADSVTLHVTSLDQSSSVLPLGEHLTLYPGIVETKTVTVPAMLDLPTLVPRHGVTPRGVIHVGAHEGRELALYRKMGASPILFIEANPEVAATLRRTMADEADVMVAEYAVTDGSAASVTLHVASLDQSSSVLPLGEHLTLYPGIVETKTVTVPAVSLDALLARLGLDPAAFNLLNIDIQGAELPALTGAQKTLAHIEAVNAEINFRELYVGGTFFHELAAFLHDQGFVCEASTCPYDPGWGDALFVRRRELHLTTLGTNGRFANQLFQYAFAKLHAARHGLTVFLPAWVGNALFAANDPPPRRALPVLRQTSPDPAADAVAGRASPARNVDLWGYFQYHSRFYAPNRQAFRALLRPVPAVAAPLAAALARLMVGKKTLVALHLRRGDYGYGHFFVAKSAWYRDWLATVWDSFEAPLLYIASDEPASVLDDFADYAPASRADLGDLPGLPLEIVDAYADFFVLTQAQALAISNSSFSFAAAMLNETASLFVRPRLSLKRLIPFHPFDAEVLLRDETVEAFPETTP